MGGVESKVGQNDSLYSLRKAKSGLRKAHNRESARHAPFVGRTARSPMLEFPKNTPRENAVD
jgi:hypothetical protein